MAVWAPWISLTWAPSRVCSQRSDPQQQTDLEVGLLWRLDFGSTALPCSFPPCTLPLVQAWGEGGRRSMSWHAHAWCLPLLCWPSYFSLYEWSHCSRTKIAATLLQSAPLIKLWPVEKWLVGGPTGPACIGLNLKEFLFEIECLFKSWASTGPHVSFKPAAVPSKPTATPTQPIYL